MYFINNSFKIIVKNRITSTKSIAKITKSMKMVAAAKLTLQKKKLAEGDAFGVNLFKFLSLPFYYF